MKTGQKGVENKADDTLKLVVFLECANMTSDITFTTKITSRKKKL